MRREERDAESAAKQESSPVREVAIREKPIEKKDFPHGNGIVKPQCERELLQKADRCQVKEAAGEVTPLEEGSRLRNAVAPPALGAELLCQGHPEASGVEEESCRREQDCKLPPLKGDCSTEAQQGKLELRSAPVAAVTLIEQLVESDHKLISPQNLQQQTAAATTLASSNLLGPLRPLSKAQPLLQPIATDRRVSSAGPSRPFEVVRPAIDVAPKHSSSRELSSNRQLPDAVSSILGAVGDLDQLKDRLHIRCESAMKQARELGARRMSRPAPRLKTTGLHWHGSKSFLEQTQGNV